MVKTEKKLKHHNPKKEDASNHPMSRGNDHLSDGEHDASEGGKASAGGGTIGQQTSGIRNKQKRSELYHKLKHNKEVRRLGELRKLPVRPAVLLQVWAPAALQGANEHVM